jgi:hypothetical protein
MGKMHGTIAKDGKAKYPPPGCQEGEFMEVLSIVLTFVENIKP